MCTSLHYRWRWLPAVAVAAGSSGATELHLTTMFFGLLGGLAIRSGRRPAKLSMGPTTR